MTPIGSGFVTVWTCVRTDVVWNGVIGRFFMVVVFRGGTAECSGWFVLDCWVDFVNVGRVAAALDDFVDGGAVCV